jgi:choline dehydrogenase-like flavoprotein
VAIEKYDAVVVGSGAGGAMAAWMLTRAGAKVLMLEAGRDYDPGEAAMLNFTRDAPLRGVGTPDKDFGYYDATVDGGWDIPGEPYAMAQGTEFKWWRSRMLGGRTNHWARNSFRMGELDFKPYSRDGLGVDWPISYDELAPWYDKTETIVGVYGNNPDLENHPNSGAGVLHDPPAPRAWEIFLKAGAAKVGVPVIPARRAVLTRAVDTRQPCYWASECGRGCAIGAAFQTTTSLIPQAKATGKLTVRTDAMVHEVVLDRRGKASGVRFIDRKTGAQREASGRVVILAASTGETARILLNTKVAGRSEGLANSSGQLGRNLMDTVGADLSATFPALEGRPRYNEDGAMGLHVYIPFWLYKEQKAGKLGFARGYHFEVGGGFNEPGGDLGGLDGYGASLRSAANRTYGSRIGFTLRGEMIPNANSYCEIDPTLKDRFGIPALRFHFGWTDQERKMVDHFHQTTQEIVTAMGGKLTAPPRPADRALKKGGEIIHEVGTARMGADRRTSVTDGYGRCWDVDNLYIGDGAVFASKAHKNPTLTIMALAMRSADHIAARLRKGEL